MHFPNGTLQKPSFRQIHEQTCKQNPSAWHSDLPQGKQNLPQMAIPIGTDTWKCRSSMIVMYAMIGMLNPKGTQKQSISKDIKSYFILCMLFPNWYCETQLGKENETHGMRLAQPKSKFKPREKQNPKSHQGFGRGIGRGTGRGTKVISFDTLPRHAPGEQRRRERRKKRKRRKTERQRSERRERGKREREREIDEREMRERERKGRRERERETERQRDREVREERKERERERWKRRETETQRDKETERQRSERREERERERERWERRERKERKERKENRKTVENKTYKIYQEVLYNFQALGLAHRNETTTCCQVKYQRNQSWTKVAFLPKHGPDSNGYIPCVLDKICTGKKHASPQNQKHIGERQKPACQCVTSQK